MIQRQVASSFQPVVIDPNQVVAVEVSAFTTFRPEIFGYGTDWPRRAYKEPRFPRLSRLIRQVTYLLTGTRPAWHMPDPVHVEQIYIGRAPMFYSAIPLCMFAEPNCNPVIGFPLVEEGEAIRVVLSSKPCACRECEDNADDQRSVMVRLGVAGWTPGHERQRLPPEISEQLESFLWETKRRLATLKAEQAEKDN